MKIKERGRQIKKINISNKGLSLVKDMSSQMWFNDTFKYTVEK